MHGWPGQGRPGTSGFEHRILLPRHENGPCPHLLSGHLVFFLHSLCWEAQSLPAKSRWTPPAPCAVLSPGRMDAFFDGVFVPEHAWLGFRLVDYVPKEEVDYIMKNNLPGPLFNDYLIGGYMMWAMYPDYKGLYRPSLGTLHGAPQPAGLGQYGCLA